MTTTRVMLAPSTSSDGIAVMRSSWLKPLPPLACLAAALFVAAPSLAAEPPADAPTCADLPRGRSLLLEQSELTPFRAQCIDEPEMVRRECINERNAGELAKAREFVWLTKPVLGLLVGSAAAGVVATVLAVVLAVMAR